MTPVEAMKTSLGVASGGLGSSSAVMRVASLPFLPVKALALPELTTSARALPRFRFSRHHKTGAEQVLDRVSTPATAVP